jgi:TPR repeat protein
MKTKILCVLLTLACVTSFVVHAQTFDQSMAAYSKGDYATAINGFRQLAAQGDANAQFNLGYIYFYGEGTPKDQQQALFWIGKAAEKGVARAQRHLGFMYSSGKGVPKDDQQAAFWYRKAADQNNADAQFLLGSMYSDGKGVPKDDQQAAFWYRKAADQNSADAQFLLGSMYSDGKGVPKDDQQAVFWYRKAAEQGDAGAQNNLGLMYSNGQGVPKDEQTAYFWYLLSSAKGDQDAIWNRDKQERRLTLEQRSTAQTAARNWRPRTASQSSNLPATVSTPAARSPPDTIGSGFRVAHGVIVTNNHVINGCGRLSVNGVVAKVLGSDARTDLALLNSSLSGQNTNLRARRVSVGEPVAVAGYPLRGLLSGFNMTTGNLSSLSGIGGDTRLVQITAPVQPGNSGGPVLDSAGNLIGVVVSKLDAVRAAKITGDIPQNVNFAINANVLRSFLDANSVEYETASTDKALLPTAIADRAKGFTVLVECWK